MTSGAAPFYRDTGYYFIDQRGIGRHARLAVRADGALIHKGRKLPPAPPIAEAGDTWEPLRLGVKVVIDFTDLTALTLHRSWRTGTGLEFTRSDGSRVKFAGQALAFSRAEEVYRLVARAAHTLNPNLVLDPPLD